MTLLELVNSEAGRHLLGIKHKLPIVKVSDNSFHTLIEYDPQKDRALIRASFFSSPRLKYLFGTVEDKIQIANDEYKRIEDYYEAFLHFSGLELKRHKYPSIFLVTDAFNGSTGEGLVSTGVKASWAAARGATTGTAIGGNGSVRVQAWNFGSFVLDRNFEPFDTSSIPDSAIVSAADINYYRSDAIDSFHNDHPTTWEVVPSTQASPTALADADFDNITFSSKGSINLSATANNTYFSITITDLTLISLTGYTMLAGIAGVDLSNTSPTGRNQCQCQERDDANPPRLDVTYTAPAGGLLHFFRP